MASVPSDDGESLVVPEGTSVIDGLLMLVQEVYGGERFAPDNPAIVKALPFASVGVWRGPCSDAFTDGLCVDSEEYSGWYAPGGDGPHSITVADYDGSAYSLGEDAEAAEGGGEGGGRD